MPWGEEQDRALAALILALTLPPILAMPDWNKSFQLQTDASWEWAQLLPRDTKSLNASWGIVVIGGLEPTPGGHLRNGK